MACPCYCILFQQRLYQPGSFFPFFFSLISFSAAFLNTTCTSILQKLISPHEHLGSSTLSLEIIIIWANSASERRPRANIWWWDADYIVCLQRAVTNGGYFLCFPQIHVYVPLCFSLWKSVFSHHLLVLFELKDWRLEFSPFCFGGHKPTQFCSPFRVFRHTHARTQNSFPFIVLSVFGCICNVNGCSNNPWKLPVHKSVQHECVSCGFTPLLVSLHRSCIVFTPKVHHPAAAVQPRGPRGARLGGAAGGDPLRLHRHRIAKHGHDAVRSAADHHGSDAPRPHAAPGEPGDSLLYAQCHLLTHWLMFVFIYIFLCRVQPSRRWWEPSTPVCKQCRKPRSTWMRWTISHRWGRTW